VVDLVDQQELHVSYVVGLHRRTGLWTLRPHEYGTQLCYQIDLEPKGFLPRLLSNVIDSASIHSKGMEKVFDGLQQWLSKNSGSQVIGSKGESRMYLEVDCFCREGYSAQEPIASLGRVVPGVCHCWTVCY
jgi:hypothetical protein